MKVVFAILTIILFFGVVGEDDKDRAKNYTMAFIACVVATVLLTLGQQF